MAYDRWRPQTRSSTVSSNIGDDDELDVERILTDISYLKVCIEEVNLTGADETLRSLVLAGSVYNFLLSYSIPTVRNSPPQLSARQDLYCTAFSDRSIKYRHRRVVSIKANRSLLEQWRLSFIEFSLTAKMRVDGSFLDRPVGRAMMSLSRLVEPPFHSPTTVYFRHPSHGMTASCTVKMHFGTNVPLLAERLEKLRQIATQIPPTSGRRLSAHTNAHAAHVPARARRRSESRRRRCAFSQPDGRQRTRSASGRRSSSRRESSPSPPPRHPHYTRPRHDSPPPVPSQRIDAAGGRLLTGDSRLVRPRTDSSLGSDDVFIINNSASSQPKRTNSSGAAVPPPSSRTASAMATALPNRANSATTTVTPYLPSLRSPICRIDPHMRLVHATRQAAEDNLRTHLRELDRLVRRLHR